MIIPVSFQGKRILVTGAGRGLGKAIVQALVQKEGTVFALSRTKSKLDELKAELPQVTTLCVDLENWEKTRQIVQEVGTVHMLVNNAALNIAGDMMRVTPEDFDRTFHTNVRSTMNVTQVVAQNMIDRNEGGSIVTISSIAQGKPILKQGLYGVSKSASGMMARVFAQELGRHNIRVNTVNPGVFPSDMSKQALDNPNSSMMTGILNTTPLKRIATTEEIVNAVLFLLSDLSPYITGQSLYICGGYT